MLSNTLLQLLLSREVVYTYKQQEAGASAVKVTFIFKVFGARSYLMVA